MSDQNDKNGQYRNDSNQVDNLLNDRAKILVYLNENNNLKKEIAFLNDINMRLGQELVELQTTTGIVKKSILDQYDSQNVNTGAVGFILNELTYIMPLINAYDVQMEQMQHVLSMSYEQIRQMERKSEELILTNNQLRKDMEKQYENMLNLYQSGHPDEGLVSSLVQLEMQDLKERNQLLLDENQEYEQKYEELALKFDSIQRENDNSTKLKNEIHTKFKESQDIIQKLDSQQSALETTRHQLEQKLKSTTDKLIFSQQNQHQVESEKLKALNEVKLLRNQNMNLQSIIDEEMMKKNGDIKMLDNDIISLRNKERENLNRLNQFERDNELYQEDNRKLRQQLETAKSDAEVMMKMMDNYENEKINFKKKEDQLVQKERELKEIYNNSQIELDKAQLQQDSYEKSLREINDRTKKELDDYQQKYTEIIENLKQQHRDQIETKEDELNQKSQQLMVLSETHERLQKDLQAANNERLKLSSAFRDDMTMQYDEKITDYERLIAQLEEKLHLTEQDRNDQISSLHMEQSQIQHNFKNLQVHVNDLKGANQSLRNNQHVTQTENGNLKSQLNTLLREKQNALEDISQIKKHFENKLEYSNEQYNYKMKELQEQLNDAIRREQTSREKAIELLSNHDRIEERLKFEYESRIKELEKYITTLKAQNKTINNKVKAMQDTQ